MFLGLWGFALSNHLHNLQVQAAVPDCPSDSLSDQSILMHLFDGLLPIITLDCIRSISSIAAGLYFSLSVFQGPITGLWCVIVPVRLFKLVILMCLHTVNLWMQTQGSVLSSPCVPCLQQLLQGSSQLFLIGLFKKGKMRPRRWRLPWRCLWSKAWGLVLCVVGVEWLGKAQEQLSPPWIRQCGDCGEAFRDFRV